MSSASPSVSMTTASTAVAAAVANTIGSFAHTASAVCRAAAISSDTPITF